MLGTYDSKDDFPLRKTGTEGFAEVVLIVDILHTSTVLHWSSFFLI